MHYMLKPLVVGLLGLKVLLVRKEILDLRVQLGKTEVLELFNKLYCQLGMPIVQMVEC